MYSLVGSLYSIHKIDAPDGRPYQSGRCYALFTRVRGIRILRTSPFGDSRKFGQIFGSHLRPSPGTAQDLSKCCNRGKRPLQ